ncbi:hypothetical protein PIB30_036360, partial [Stylosanthes scabra]|nr:hypothetical protein [Stylosanthes scabra]
MGATVAVFRNNDGGLIRTATSKISATSAPIIEANAIRDSLIIATNMNINNLIIETDCQELYQAIKSNSSIAKV